MITDIGHAAVRAYDLDKTLAFYALLGIKPAFHLDKPEGGLMLVYLHVGGDRFIEVFPGGKEPPPTNRVAICTCAWQPMTCPVWSLSYEMQVSRLTTAHPSGWTTTSRPGFTIQIATQ